MNNPALLGLIVVFGIGCSDSGTTFLDGPAPAGDVGHDQLVQLDAQAADAQVTDAKVADAKVADAKVTDAQAADMQAKDAVVPTDGNTSFPQALDGIWLVGWIGGLNRFSWVRFKVTSKSGGTAIINKGTLTGGTVPYWDCSGATTWNITSKPDTIQLHFPSSLCNGMKSGSYTFVSIAPFTGTYPKGATFKASIQAQGSSPATVSGYKFPASQCDATMTTCKDPL